MREHPDPHLIERFMRNELAGADNKRIVRHLISGCSQCLDVTRRFWTFGDPPPDAPPELLDLLAADRAGRPAPSGPPGVISRLAGPGRRRERKIAQERARAPWLLAEILAQPRPRRLGLVCGDNGFQNLALCELLIEKSREEAQLDPLLSVETAEIAVATIANTANTANPASTPAATRLDAKLWGAPLAGTLHARAWAYLGNARRLAGDASGAERALAVAESLLGRIASHPLDRAELRCLEACLSQDARKYDQAERSIDEAIAIYQEAGEHRLLGEALIQKGMLLGALGRPEAAARAVDLLREGLGRIDERVRPALAADTLHRLAGLLQEAGRAEEALQAVEEARSLYTALDDQPNLLRLRRLEGRIEESERNLEAADAIYRETREAFLAAGLGREAGISHIHLALLYARQDRTHEVFRLSQELSPILRVRDVHQSHDSLAALLAFRGLAEGGSAAPELLVEVQHCLAGPRAPVGSAPVARVETPTPYAMAFLLSAPSGPPGRIPSRVPWGDLAEID